MAAPTFQRGVTLVELLMAVVISALVLAAINGLVKLGLDAQTSGRAVNELTYQGRFALERISDKARALTPKALTTPAANTTGDWLAPSGCTGAACVMICRNASSQLIETSTADNTCGATTVIANNVSAFAAALPAGRGAVDRSMAVISMTLSMGTDTVAMASSMRLGGGTQ
jgi:prepilin-type N-terminal cleavage/methylation domain-containing protein